MSFYFVLRTFQGPESFASICPVNEASVIFPHSSVEIHFSSKCRNPVLYLEVLSTLFNLRLITDIINSLIGTISH